MNVRQSFLYYKLLSITSLRTNKKRKTLLHISLPPFYSHNNASNSAVIRHRREASVPEPAFQIQKADKFKLYKPQLIIIIG